MNPRWSEITNRVSFIVAILCVSHLIIFMKMPLLGYFIQIGAIFGYLFLMIQQRYLIVIAVSIVSIILPTLVYGFSIAILLPWLIVTIAPVAFGLLYQSGVSASKCLLISGLIIFVSSVAYYFLILKPGYETLFALAEEWLVKMMALNGYDSITMDASIDNLRQSRDFLMRLMPSMLGLNWFMVLFVGWAFVSQFHKKFDSYIPNLPEFIFWKMPIFVLYLTGLTLLVRMIGNDSIAPLADNLLFVIGFFYAVFGFSLMEFYLKKINATTMIKVLFYLCIGIMFLPGLIFAAAIGFIDSYFDFRKVKAKIIG